MINGGAQPLAQHPERTGPAQTLDEDEQTRDERQYAPRDVLEDRPGRHAVAQEHGDQRHNAGHERGKTEPQPERGREQHDDRGRADAAGSDASTARQVR